MATVYNPSDFWASSAQLSGTYTNSAVAPYMDVKVGSAIANIGKSRRKRVVFEFIAGQNKILVKFVTAATQDVNFIALENLIMDSDTSFNLTLYGNTIDDFAGATKFLETTSANMMTDGFNCFSCFFNNTDKYSHIWVELDTFTDDVSIGRIWIDSISGAGTFFTYPPANFNQAYIESVIKNEVGTGMQYASKLSVKKVFSFDLMEVSGSFLTAIKANFDRNGTWESWWFYYPDDTSYNAHKVNFFEPISIEQSIAHQRNVSIILVENPI